MNKQTREDMKRIRTGFNAHVRDRLLHDVYDALALELKTQAKLVLPPPTGKYDRDNKVGMKAVFVGTLAERDRLKAREVMQRAGNPAELQQMLRKLLVHGED